MGKLTRMLSEAVSTFERLEQFGVTPEQLKEFRRNDEVALRVARAFGVKDIVGRRTTPDSSGKSAYHDVVDLLGDDFIPPGEIMNATGVQYTPEQVRHLIRTIPPLGVLEWARDNNFAVVAGPPSEMNLPDIYELNRDLFYSENDPWFADKGQRFARKHVVGTTWLVIRKDPVPNSTYKTWNEQVALLDSLDGLEYVPNAAEAAWFFTIYARVRRIRLVPSVYVRTSSVDSDGFRVHVGRFGMQVLGVHSGRDDYVVNDSIGVASARKF